MTAAARADVSDDTRLFKDRRRRAHQTSTRASSVPRSDVSLSSSNRVMR